MTSGGAPIEAKAAVAALAGALALVGGAARAEGKDCAGVFYFDPHAKLTVNEFIAFGDYTSVRAADDRVLAAATTFWEGYPSRGKWDELAVVYASDGSGYADVIGGVLWTTDRSAFGSWGTVETRKAGKDIFLVVRPSEPMSGCVNGFTFKLDGQRVLWANGTRIGVTPTLP
ncbi:hypothetical protein [Phenylobacterium sp.]|uniref:hypothetical protein n=1 Tax=Phenylobacterium sp. TaxID=1871053 RepID=UPI0035B2EDE0